MAVRTVICIDEERCDGCGLCTQACHEGALGLVNGKAKLLRDDFCDGMGDCLPACPQDAISFVEREAAAYDQAAVDAAKSALASLDTQPAAAAEPCPSGLPVPTAQAVPSRITNWPLQIKLTPTQAPCFQGAHLLVAADCTAFAYGNFHADFMANTTCLIACPKLDNCDYAEKLTEIFANNSIQQVTLTRMVVPCCGGLENMTRRALAACGKEIPLQVTTFSLDGQILE
ncbi:MAG: ferredoxin [Coriobacteriia bacterium]|nr:ferredoxin [Coriobacteriia bacterium]